MGFLSDDELTQLRLVRMSLHIVGTDDEFEGRPELAVEHDDFLLHILKEVASDSVYRFEEISTTRTNIESIASGQQNFELGAQLLAADFNRIHEGSTAKDGAFFVFELGVMDPSTSIYALVKYDYSPALEIIHRDETTALRQIVEAFVRNKVAIQKSAFIRTRDGVAEPAVSTRDRMGRPAPDLTDFFRGYLQVTRDRSDEELTTDAKEVVRTSLTDNRELLPAGGTANAVSRAINILRDAPQIDDQTIQQAVWIGAGRPTDENTVNKLNNTVNRALRKKKLIGVGFAPSATALPRSVKRSITTREGVKLEYNTALSGQAVLEQELDDGRTRFTVITRGYKDAVNPDRNGRTPQ